MKIRQVVCSIFVVFPMMLVAQEAPQVIHLWTNGTPGFESRKDIPETGIPAMIKSVDNPSLTVFLPPKDRANGAAMVVCPGGGFYQLSFISEGTDAARFLNTNGMAAFVLKYRLPRLTNSVYTLESPHEDGLRAMRLVRSHASEWGIDPHRIGMMGFSAGGEVTSMTTFGDTDGITNAHDPVDQVDAHPDFIVEIYPGPLGIPPALPANAPPAFLLVAGDDNHAENVLKLSTLYRAAKIPVEVHVLSKGGHGFGMGKRSRVTAVKDWPQRLADWLVDAKILNPAPPAKPIK